MGRLVFLVFSILTITVFNSFGQDNVITLTDYADDKLKSGQIWQYQSRNGDEDSRVVILKTEQAENGQVIIHISVIDVKQINSDNGEVKITSIGHLPFSREALLESLTILESSNNETPDFSEGYSEWRKAFESGEAGYFTISVKEVVEYLLKG